jgi:hypothetical protein
VRLAWVLTIAACYHGGAEPPSPTCTDAAEHVRALIEPPGARAGRIRDVVAERCAADGWSAEVRACVVATPSLRQPQHCKAKLTAAQRAAFDQDLAHGLAGFRAVAPAARLPQACRDYRALIDKLGACSVLPPGLREVFERGYRELARTWASGATPDMPTLEVQCRLLASSLRHVVAQPCGW